MFKYPAIPEPTTDITRLRESVMALKEAVEMLTGQRGEPSKYFVDKRILDLQSEFKGADSQTNARLTQIDETFADATRALAQRTTVLEADYKAADEDINAKVTEVSLASAQADEALARRAETLEASLSKLDTDTNAKIQRIDEARATGDEALANSFSQLETEFRRADLVTQARITDVDMARVREDEALAKRTSQLEVSFTNGTRDLNARVDNEQRARVDGDNATAEMIGRVEAKANGISASGEVRMDAAGGANGYAASYKVKLTAAQHYAGMTLGVDSTGAGSIAFEVGSFKLIDPTTTVAKTVFTYSAGKFKFTGDVNIDGNLVISGTINTLQIAAGAVTNMAAAQAVRLSTATARFNCRLADRVVAIVTLQPYAEATGSMSSNKWGCILKLDGGQQKQFFLDQFRDIMWKPSTTGDPVPIDIQTAVTRQFIFDATFTGDHVLTAEVGDAAQVFLTVISFSR